MDLLERRKYCEFISAVHVEMAFYIARMVNITDGNVPSCRILR